jgi:hypothetical protein
VTVVLVATRALLVSAVQQVPVAARLASLAAQVRRATVAMAVTVVPAPRVRAPLLRRSSTR